MSPLSRSLTVGSYEMTIQIRVLSQHLSNGIFSVLMTEPEPTILELSISVSKAQKLFHRPLNHTLSITITNRQTMALWE